MNLSALAARGFSVDEAPLEMLAFHSATRVPGLVFTSGQVPALGDVAIKGQVGGDIDLATAQLAAELCVVNCMGLGAKEIFNDAELTPVSGQLACLIPQSEVTYKLITKGANIIARKDGIYLGGNGLVGNWDTTPKREYTQEWVEIIQQVMKEMRS